jgi:hypothetical protein
VLRRFSNFDDGSCMVLLTWNVNGGSIQFYSGIINGRSEYGQDFILNKIIYSSQPKIVVSIETLIEALPTRRLSGFRIRALVVLLSY